METRAQQLRRLKSNKKEQLHTVDCSCEMSWQCRKVGLDFWVASGIMPAKLVSAMVTATEKAGGDAQAAVQSMAAEEVLQSIVFSNRVVRHTAVDPKIVETVTNPELEVSTEEVGMCCYTTLLNWQVQGGDEAKVLETFRQE